MRSATLRLVCSATLLLLWSALSVRLSAQVIEFDPPSEIVIDESRLIVTFSEAVTLQEARTIAAELRADVVNERESETDVWVLMPTIPEPDSVLSLRRKLSSDEDQPPARLSVFPPSVTREAQQALHLRLTGAVSEAVATEIVRSRFPDASYRIQQHPLELTVALREDDDEMIDAFDAHPLVRYVTFVSIEEAVEE